MKSQRATLVCMATCTLVVVGSILSGLQSRAEIDRRTRMLSAGLEASQSRLEREVAELRRRGYENPTATVNVERVARELEGFGQQVAQLHPETQWAHSLDLARQSVALLLVGYGLYDKDTGRSWRLVSIDDGDPRHPDGQAEPSDDRAAREAYYTTGTGFVIAGNQIVTNRHVAQPWWRDHSGEAAIERGFEPRYTALRAYFPGESQPVELQVPAVSPEADIAILTTATPLKRTPLKLAPLGRDLHAGERIVIISYPAGFDALLAKADEAVAQDLRARFGDHEPALARALARENLVTPLVAVGHVGDVLPGRLVYDAVTGPGSSGGPVLNAAGEVVAVNYGGMDEFPGVRFGVPVRFVHRLLETDPDSVVRP